MRLGYSSAAPYRGNERRAGEYGLDNIKIKGYHRKMENNQGRNHMINVQQLDDSPEPYANEPTSPAMRTEKSHGATRDDQTDIISQSSMRSGNFS